MTKAVQAQVRNGPSFYCLLCFLFLVLTHTYVFMSHTKSSTSPAFMSSILFKQMHLYLSLPIFVYLLKWCTLPTPPSPLPSTFLKKLLILATTVLALTIILISPFPPLQVLTRLFPVTRGLYESKVANLWCILDTRPLDIQTRLSSSFIKILCIAFSVLGCTPFLYRIWNIIGTLNKNVAGCGLTFFLFSYHVHEKTCLVFLPPFILAFKPQISSRLIIICGMGCRFLIGLDGLVLEYYGITLLFLGFYEHFYGEVREMLFRPKEFIDYVHLGCIHFSVVLEFTMLFFPNPVERLPDLYELIIATNAFVAFFTTWAWMVLFPTETNDKIIKKNK